MRQKSRVQWLNLGNAKYVFAHMKNRVAQNTITSLTIGAIIIVHSQKDIVEEAMNFYQGLFGQTTTCLPI